MFLFFIIKSLDGETRSWESITVHASNPSFSILSDSIATVSPFQDRVLGYLGVYNRENRCRLLQGHRFPALVTHSASLPFTMAANYWSSTQKMSWTFSKTQLAEMRKKLEDKDRQLISQYPLPDRRMLNIYFSQQLGRLGKRMSVRQQALATAQVYMRRFYTKVEIRHTNPYLVLSTAFYLACKMEECQQHIRLVVGEARQFWPGILIKTRY